MRHGIKPYYLLFLVALAAVSGRPVYGEQEGGISSVSYLYTLSNFAGSVPVNWSNLALDEKASEVYVTSGGIVKIFNDTGMEIYNFNAEYEFGNILDAAVDGDGNIIVLSYPTGSTKSEIIRCNYRGEPIAKIELKNFPEEYAGLVNSSRIVFRNGSLYLASLSAMKVAVIDGTGKFKDGYDLASFMDFSEQDRVDSGIVGFNVDPEGKMLFTVPAMGKAFILSPDRTIQSFGTRGSRPGAFGVPGGITSDASGKYLFVADTLRCKVIIFDNNLRFKMEFGTRGRWPGGLIAPRDLIIDAQNRIYVAQMGKRGINVYQIAL